MAVDTGHSWSVGRTSAQGPVLISKNDPPHPPPRGISALGAVGWQNWFFLSKNTQQSHGSHHFKFVSSNPASAAKLSSSSKTLAHPPAIRICYSQRFGPYSEIPADAPPIHFRFARHPAKKLHPSLERWLLCAVRTTHSIPCRCPPAPAPGNDVTAYNADPGLCHTRRLWLVGPWHVTRAGLLFFLYRMFRDEVEGRGRA